MAIGSKGWRHVAPRSGGGNGSGNGSDNGSGVPTVQVERTPPLWERGVGHHSHAFSHWLTSRATPTRGWRPPCCWVTPDCTSSIEPPLAFRNGCWKGSCGVAVGWYSGTVGMAPAIALHATKWAKATTSHGPISALLSHPGHQSVTISQSSGIFSRRTCHVASVINCSSGCR